MKVTLKLKANGKITTEKDCKSKAEAMKIAKKYLSGFTMHEKVKNKIDYSITKK